MRCKTFNAAALQRQNQTVWPVLRLLAGIRALWSRMRRHLFEVGQPMPAAGTPQEDLQQSQNESRCMDSAGTEGDQGTPEPKAEMTFGTVVSVRALPVKRWWHCRQIQASVVCKCGRKAQITAPLKMVGLDPIPFCCLACGQPVPLGSMELLAKVVTKELQQFGERN